MIGKLESTNPLIAGRHPPKDNPAKVRDAVSQFEALLIGQMLKAMQPAEDGEDQAGGIALEVAQECFASAIAKNGGLGLKPVLVEGLTKG